MELHAAIEKKSIELCKSVIDMTSSAGSGHASTGLSLAHIVTTLMYRIMRYDPKDPWNRTSDRLVLSEGHAVPIVYAAYADLGGAVGSPQNRSYLKSEDLKGLREIESVLDGHPNPPEGFPFFDCATGSLGQGLSCACGLALADRLDSVQRRHYVLIGDGESREGQIWEACNFMVDHNLLAVVPVFNCNGYGQSDAISKQESADTLQAKLRAFGLEVHQVDGHSPSELIEAFDRIRASGVCSAVIARTVKGWGVPEFQRKNYHGKPLSKDMVEEALEKLDGKAKDLGEVEVSQQIPSLAPSEPYTISEKRAPSRLGPPDFGRLLQGDKAMAKFEDGKLSTRRAYGLALRELGALDDTMVVLDGDVRNSTYSEYFLQSEPDRFFESRIAEQNMVSVANGLAAAGKTPYVSTFAKFLVRAYDQIELALISGNKINFCGSHSGANIGADGPSQMGLTDLAFFRSLTTLSTERKRGQVVCFNPACAIAAYRCVELMNLHPGIAYMRTIRQPTPILYHPDEPFEIGGFKRLREGGDLAILASGYMVHKGIEIAQRLSETRGIEASVIDCYCIPIHENILADVIRQSQGRLVTLEDNYGNGLGAEIASLSARPGSPDAKVMQLFVTRVPKSGRSPDDVLRYVGLDIGHITDLIVERADSMHW